MICIKNGKVHDGKGKVAIMDILIQDGKITRLKSDLDVAEAEIIDASGLEVFPGFIDPVSDWGILGPGREIRGNANDNDEKSDQCTPEMDVIWAVNGRAMERQQLAAWGITAVGVAPSNNNVFGGKMAAYQIVGKNPMKMILKEKIGMKASVTEEVTKTYGSRNLAPMTKMGVFSMMRNKLREAAEEKTENKDVAPDFKREALHEMLQTKMPLFVSCNTPTEIRKTLHALKEFDLPLVFINGFGVDGSLTELLEHKTALVLGNHTEGMNRFNRTTDYKGIYALMQQGLTVSFCASGRGFGGREDLLWNALEMYKVIGQEETILSMLTLQAARILGIEEMTGSIEEGKRADLVLWSANPITSYHGAVVRTLVAGETVYKKGDAMRCFL